MKPNKSSAIVKSYQTQQILRLSKTASAHSSLITSTDYGRLIWGKIPGHRSWPGTIVNPDDCGMKTPPKNRAWVFWFADNRVSLVPLLKIFDFAKNFTNQYTRTDSGLYDAGVLECLREFRLQSGVEALDSKEVLLQWAYNGFPNSVDFKQMKDAVLSPKTNECLNCIKEHLRSSFPSSSSSFSLDSPSAVERKIWELKASSLLAVRNGKCDIETLCIACDRSDYEAVSPHPYFFGGICGKCKEEADDAVMTLGDEGIYICCAVCGGAGEVFVCDAPQCERVFCIGCVELLVSPDVAQHIIEIDPWQCFLCEPYHPDTHGLLKPRPDWKEKVFDRSDIHHPSNVPDVEDDTPDASSFPNRPLRVLSIFDGIGTGLYVLDELALEVEVYYASEIDGSAMNVASLNFGSRVTFIGDIQTITDKQISQICPIDLLIGGSPCNDLSRVNPKRKGLYDPTGTGILFFHFFRAQKVIQAHNDKIHLFWLFENVVNMPKEFKTQISLFLQKEPSRIDAKYFSPQVRSRYFWGNLPGMFRPIPQHLEKKHCLNQYLNKIGDREALVEKINCITTNPASLKLGVTADWPIRMNDHGDVPWTTEVEKIFGFPPHYTDVGNLTPKERKTLLGRAWSVPVILHILKPLTEYFPLKQKSSLMEREENQDSQTRPAGEDELQILQNTLDANHTIVEPFPVSYSFHESPTVEVENIDMLTQPSINESQRSQIVVIADNASPPVVCRNTITDELEKDSILHQNDLQKCTDMTSLAFSNKSNKEQNINMERSENMIEVYRCHEGHKSMDERRDGELRSVRMITKNMRKKYQSNINFMKKQRPRKSRNPIRKEQISKEMKKKECYPKRGISKLLGFNEEERYHFQGRKATKATGWRDNFICEMEPNSTGEMHLLCPQFNENAAIETDKIQRDNFVHRDNPGYVCDAYNVYCGDDIMPSTSSCSSLITPLKGNHIDSEQNFGTSALNNIGPSEQLLNLIDSAYSDEVNYFEGF